MSRPISLRVALSASAVLTAGSMVLAGCGGLSRAVGAAKVAPDEFRVVTKAPLVIPPEYNLRPPRPGEARPQELQPSDLARGAMFGTPANGVASDAEQLLAAKAGAASADPTIRTVIDVEDSGIIRKTTGFANRILFFTDADNVDEANPVDAVSEEERLRREAAARNATGEDAEVSIRRGGSMKLPGL